MSRNYKNYRIIEIDSKCYSPQHLNSMLSQLKIFMRYEGQRRQKKTEQEIACLHSYSLESICAENVFFSSLYFSSLYFYLFIFEHEIAFLHLYSLESICDENVFFEIFRNF